MRCPDCGQSMSLEDKDASSGREMRSYFCERCEKQHVVDDGAALWTARSEGREDGEARRSAARDRLAAAWSRLRAAAGGWFPGR